MKNLTESRDAALVIICTTLLSFFVFFINAHASTIYSGDIINDNGFFSSVAPSTKINDQSGLSETYISGLTDFNVYSALNPTHTGSSALGNGTIAEYPAFIDFDFQQTLSFTDFGLWNDIDSQSVHEFNLLIADNDLFDGATLLGQFTATYESSTNNTTPISLQTFALNGLSGRYIRLNLISNHGAEDLFDFINVGEVIFGAQEAGDNVVPEPTTMLLFGVGLLGIAGVGRRRNQYHAEKGQ